MTCLCLGVAASKILRVKQLNCNILTRPTFKYVLSTIWVSQESIGKFLIANQFLAKLRIVSLYICKQCLKVLKQWSSTWAKSPLRGLFYALLGRFCDLRDLGSDFSFQGGDFCSLNMLNF